MIYKINVIKTSNLMINRVLLVIVVIGLAVFVRKRKHLLMSLIRLEFLAIMLFFGLVNLRVYGVLDGYIIMYYLVMRACEGALGLSVVVLLVRGSGNDLIIGVRITQC